MMHIVVSDDPAFTQKHCVLYIVQYVQYSMYFTYAKFFWLFKATVIEVLAAKGAFWRQHNSHKFNIGSSFSACIHPSHPSFSLTLYVLFDT